MSSTTNPASRGESGSPHEEPPANAEHFRLLGSDILLNALLACSCDRIHFKDTKSRFVAANPALLNYLNLDDSSEIVGKSDFDFYTCEEAEYFREIEERLLLTGEPIFDIELVATHPITGETTHLLSSKFPLRDRSGEIVGIVGITRDVTETYLANEARRKSEEKNSALLGAIPDSIFLLSHDGVVLDHLGPKRSDDLFSRVTVPTHVSALTSAPLAAQIMRSIELTLQTNNVQLLEFQTPTPHGPRDLEVRFTVCGDSNAVMALVRDTTFYRRLERQVLEVSGREERRIGQDLHDGLGQDLTGIAFLTKALADKLRGRALPEADDAQRIVEYVNSAISQVRVLARGLAPIGIEERGLIAALEGLAKTTSSVFGIRCEFLGRLEALDAETGAQTQLYRIAQEAVHNAVRHGKASRVTIALTEDETGKTLSIEDDGIGFDAAHAPHAGMGLHIMRYRATMVSGDLAIESHPGEGTLVACFLRHAREMPIG